MADNSMFFGGAEVGNKSSGGKTAAITPGCITPDHGGYSHVFLEEGSNAVNTWEANGLMLSEEEVAGNQELAKELKKQAMFASKNFAAIKSITKSESTIAKFWSKSKLIVAQSVKKQWDAFNAMFTGMDRLWAGYDVGKTRRQQQFQLIDKQRQTTLGTMQQKHSEQLAALSSKN
ncbi:MAG: hypothetical protein F6K18_01520 [Okeania sp. SIO2C2]|uniref:hypothetical protein n=1 Tax=Okeania sp. SIO2C2 TaxID=2607787 RepID=UPI0013BA4DB8|nr:hypothetical protein [Okeania sp. SIO2C2]NEP85609.1 hypothetical protein [Okeania sp. SIO2C2]